MPKKMNLTSQDQIQDKAICISFDIFLGCIPTLLPDIGQGGRGSIPGQVIPKTQKMVLDAALLNTQHYKVQVKSKLGQSWKRSSALSYTLV